MLSQHVFCLLLTALFMCPFKWLYSSFAIRVIGHVTTLPPPPPPNDGRHLASWFFHVCMNFIRWQLQLFWWSQLKFTVRFQSIIAFRVSHGSFLLCKGLFQPTRKRQGKVFRIPAVQNHHDDETRKLTLERRETWLNNLNLKSLKPEDADSRRVCSNHFVSGK